MEIIDAHAHIYPQKIAKKATVAIGEFYDIEMENSEGTAEKLIEEGYVRELVSKIQNLRKEAGFEVQDYIEVYYNGNEKIEKIIADNADEIAAEVLAKKVVNEKGTGFEKEKN